MWEPHARAGRGFWAARSSARFGVLIHLDRVRACDHGPEPFRSAGSRHSWFVLPPTRVATRAA